MNVQLSQRVARARQFPPLWGMDVTRLKRLARVVDDADSFDALPVDVRELIAASEKNSRDLSRQHTVDEATTAAAAAAFDFHPDQPRDDRGRWTDLPIDDLPKVQDGSYDDLMIGGQPASNVRHTTHWPEHPGLTWEENRATDKYTDDNMTKIVNRTLRGEKTPWSMDAEWNPRYYGGTFVETLDGAISKGTFARDVTLYRGIALTDAEVRQLLPGARVHDDGYLSTTFDREKAEFFSKFRVNELDHGKKRYHMEIHVPKGTHATRGAASVREAILPRGTTLEVLAWKKNTIVVKIS